ncbi:MAG: SAM-dependent methyltransferase [Actinobacteria bacterium]|nr:SAM-dependent methyltransferase [Actinomycetota bacterium]
MQDALYGEDGFFLRHAPAAHFRTSVTASPVFATGVRRLAGLVDAFLGHPDPFDLVDVGAGRGELLSVLPDVPPRWRLTGVDLGPDPGNGLAWTATVPPVHGLLVANEWLDNIPVDVLFDGRVVEVDAGGTERLGGPASAEALAWARRWWPQGRRVEVGLRRDRAWAAAVGQVRRGLAVAVDYGHVLGDRTMYGDRRPTLTGYRDGRQVLPVPDGSCDLTAHVALDACLAATGGDLVRQREALAALAISAELPPRVLSLTDPRGYLARLQTAAQATELLDPRGFGGFGWLVCPVAMPGWLDVESAQARSADMSA